jgi:hypothetical protein
MSDRIDHAAEARRNIEGLHDYQSEAGTTEASLLTVAIEAQAHATLALVEQQRIANLIAYWQLHTPRSAEESFEHRHIEVSLIDTSGDRSIDSLVREGLGL